MKKLIRKAQNGDKEAFLELFQSHKEQLYKIAFVYTRNKEDSLDVIQETAFRSFQNIVTLEKPKYFKTWLIRITINCSIDLLKSKNYIDTNGTDRLEKFSHPNEDIALYISLQQLISILNNNEKTVIVLKFYLDYTFQQISETMELPIGTVKSIYYRSLVKLRNNSERADYYDQ